MIDENNTFGVRVSAVILNEELDKILMFKGGEFWFLPGARIHYQENSIDGIKRELEEELGFKELDLSFLAILEEYGDISNKNIKAHQIEFVYKTIYNEEIVEDLFIGLDGYSKFQWISINELSNMSIPPKVIKEIVKDLDKIYNLTSKDYKN